VASSQAGDQLKRKALCLRLSMQEAAELLSHSMAVEANITERALFVPKPSSSPVRKPTTPSLVKHEIKRS